MTRLSLSHALAQSAKISFFESVIEATIDTTKDIPRSIAESGKVGMPPVDIMKNIGHLFILRMNIHLVGSVVDSPEIFWSQPDLGTCVFFNKGRAVICRSAKLPRNSTTNRPVKYSCRSSARHASAIEGPSDV